MNQQEYDNLLEVVNSIESNLIGIHKEVKKDVNQKNLKQLMVIIKDQFNTVEGQFVDLRKFIDNLPDSHYKLVIPIDGDLTKEEYIIQARDCLLKAGIEFDSGYDLRKKQWEWKLDWSLKGAVLE